MKVLTVIANPNPRSFCHAVLGEFTAGLREAGHSIEAVDLYAERFDPVFRVRDFNSYVHESMPLDVNRPRDVKAYQEKVADAQGLAFIAPVFWLGFPAILKGWFERVFTYGNAYALTAEGWAGNIKGRVGLLRHEKALVISTTLFSEEDYKAGLAEPITRVVDDFGLRYPGVKTVEHVYFYRVGVVDESSRREYLKRARVLGREFAPVPAAGSAAA
jgi:NAD(P)H dehydrogenase (quinone)